jgi:hypothetical protein
MARIADQLCSNRSVKVVTLDYVIREIYSGFLVEEEGTASSFMG